MKRNKHQKNLLGVELRQSVDESGVVAALRDFVSDGVPVADVEEADIPDNSEYKVKSIVRNRVRKQLDDDVDVLKEHFPEVYEMVVEEVCGDE